MGSACSAVSQRGEALCRFSATTYCGSLGSLLSAFCKRSFTRSWVSVSFRRTRMFALFAELSRVMSSGATWAAASAACTWPSVPESILTVALPLDTCTAGASP